MSTDTTRPEREYVLVRIDKETWDEHQKNGECPVASACCGCHLDYAVEHIVAAREQELRERMENCAGCSDWLADYEAEAVPDE